MSAQPAALAVPVAVQAQPVDHRTWVDLARRVEGAGCDALYVADHPGLTASPFVALAAAAAVTERLALGTCVVNAGLWEPLALASAVATLDVLSGGRALLGVGAGHTPQEWTATGRAFPAAGPRVDRLIEVVHATRDLLAGGTVSLDGAHVTLDAAVLDSPRPVQDPVPLLVGGAGPRVLRFAGGHADVVGLTGLGATLPDGHRHEVDWSPQALDRSVALVRDAAEAAGRSPVVEALVQHVQVTDDAEAVAAAVADHVPGATASDLLEAPFAWIGTRGEIRSKLAACERRHGIGRYVVREPALDSALEVLGGTDV